MKHILTLVACAILCMTLVALASSRTLSNEKRNAASAESNHASLGMPHGEVKKGLAAFLLCHKKRFKVGEPIPLSYGLVLVDLGLDKESDETVHLRIRVFRPLCISDPENYSWFEVTGPDGEKVPYGGPYDSFPLFSPTDENSAVLRHGDFLGRTDRDLDRSGRFDLSKPGMYKVRWGYWPNDADGVWSSGALMSNVVAFEIISR